MQKKAEGTRFLKGLGGMVLLTVRRSDIYLTPLKLSGIGSAVGL